MRPLLAAFRIGFTHTFAYRVEVVIQLVSAMLVLGLNGSLWTVATRGRASVAGVPAHDMVSYVAIAWVCVSFIATRVNEEIGRRFREGQIAADLLRPGGLQTFWYARDLGRACGSLLVLTAPLFCAGLFAFGPRMPERPSTWAVWTVSLLLAHATNFGLSFLVGVAAVKLHDVTGLSQLKGTLVSMFSGALIPLDLFGPVARAFVTALPFHTLVHTPATIFLERGDVLPLLAGQVAWAAGLWALGALAWRGATAHLTVQGG